MKKRDAIAQRPGGGGGGHALRLCLTRVTNGGSSQMGKESVAPDGRWGAAGGPKWAPIKRGGVSQQSRGRRNPLEWRSAEVGQLPGAGPEAG